MVVFAKRPKTSGRKAGFHCICLLRASARLVTNLLRHVA